MTQGNDLRMRENSYIRERAEGRLAVEKKRRERDGTRGVGGLRRRAEEGKSICLGDLFG